MINNKYGVLGMPVRSSSLTATQPPLAPPTAGSAVQGPEPGGFGMYPAMADGGIVDDQDADDSNYTVDLTAAVQAAQEALNYGRQQHGIPLEAFGDNPVMDTVSKLSQKTGPGLDANLQKPQPKPEQDDESQEPQPDNEAAEGETSAYAEGGEVEGDDAGGGVIPNEAPQGNSPQDPTTAADRMAPATRAGRPP